MLIHKTIKTVGVGLNSNNFRDNGYEKFEDYKEDMRHKSAKLGDLVRTERMGELYDYVFGKTNENPMDSAQI